MENKFFIWKQSLTNIHARKKYNFFLLRKPVKVELFFSLIKLTGPNLLLTTLGAAQWIVKSENEQTWYGILILQLIILQWLQYNRAYNARLSRYAAFVYPY